MDSTILHRLSIILNCRIIKVPFTYLGVHIRGNHSRKDYWKGVIVKIKKKLSRLNGKFIYMAGMVRLIKSVTSTMPLFLVSIFKIPHSGKMRSQRYNFNSYRLGP